MNRRKVAIAIGDPAGIGPEIALKAALDTRVRNACRPLLVGDQRVIETHAALCGIAPRLIAYRSADKIDWTRHEVALLALDQFGTEAVAIGQIRAAHGRAAIEAAQAAIEAALAGHVDAVVAAPQTESAIKAAGIEFDGYPAFVARCAGVPPEDAFLMLCFDEMRIVHATLHVSLARAVALITRERVRRVIDATQTALRRMGVAAPRLAVAGLNPHAGEHGLFGDEEMRIIGPALAEAKAAGIKVEGPFGADTMFHHAGFDAFIVMFHDQGHIAAKLLARNRAAGLTIGTPVLFSSVAHGSALDIAGKNRASPEAVIEAVQRLVGVSQRKAA
ncbi:MAG TPA: 4-hydroxythreonine-4-phosphate dehydrogenase PdxA [Stellaceae bacterium]|nr:4-hydroxythreonine-4-phosphate dehydrogenase PdxA [Stellaceae bacterium]